jgi:chromosomal replication initiator protein
MDNQVQLQENVWQNFLDFIRKKCTNAEFQNWFSPIKLIEITDQKTTLKVPNIFVKEYILTNYKKELSAFLPLNINGEPSIEFIIDEDHFKPPTKLEPIIIEEKTATNDPYYCTFNRQYTFETFVEGPSNQFVKSAALGVAQHPGKSFNPLFIHGGVGLGKTHLLHGIGHYIKQHHKKLICQCITTESFINDFVNHLRDKSVDKMKKFYRNVDVLLVDDIQFLQNRLNFEEEFCNTFEALINQNKQIVITSDKPPAQLKLSQRMVARMEWGLVAQVAVPELETRVAILLNKAQQKSLKLSNPVAFFVAERMYSNIRQLEGAVNRLYAYCHLMNVEPTREITENVLEEMLHYIPKEQVTIDSIMESVSSFFEVKVSDLKGNMRLKNIAFARQVAMFLAKELVDDSLIKIASSFGGKTHSTLLHAWKKISDELKENETLSRQIQMIKKNLDAKG